MPQATGKISNNPFLGLIVIPEVTKGADFLFRTTTEWKFFSLNI
ncbi:hypothetical protein FM121_03670 [Vagococcus fluvialis bH819]|uniref:Uncharacterized protein n=1 Tax=Vagococcus fluvialis bH819 TaxID=1255619 RepID=A0A1X6WLF7_9ENTE|nr:hypothetical protein FM121_03670 [Vagococcus fluvialis bH819]